ncbi:MAG: tRNA lysidine(34) synthetase TilS, partial [Candidatus Zixiibacteriota bacterium]
MRQTITEYTLLILGDSVLVALSGGPDSVALVHLLHRLRKEFNLRLGAVYINHGIRLRAARAEEEFCQRLCDKLDIDLTIVREDVPALAVETKKGLEETAREVRYAVFESLAREDGYDKVALAHHADDRVETILFHILRGAGRTGVRGMPVKRGIFIRPLYDVAKEDIYAYLKKHRLKYCLDQSNTATDFTRNFIRNRLLPQIRKRVNPKVDDALLNLADIVGEEETFLESLAEKAWRKVASRSLGGKIQLDLEKFVEYDISLRRRLLRRCLAGASVGRYGPDKAVVDRLERFCYSSGKAMSLPHRVQAVRANCKVV